MREPKNKESEGLGGASKGGAALTGLFFFFFSPKRDRGRDRERLQASLPEAQLQADPQTAEADPGLGTPRPEFCGIASKPPCSHPTNGSRPAAERLIRRGSLISSSFLINSLAQRFGPGMFLELKRARACRGSGAEPGFAPRAPRPASNLSPQAQSVKI